MSDERSRQTRFLDLDHDGVIDAVQSTTRVTVDLDLDDVPDIVAVARETAEDIDDDGVPARIETMRFVAFARELSSRSEATTEAGDGDRR